MRQIRAYIGEHGLDELTTIGRERKVHDNRSLATVGIGIGLAHFSDSSILSHRILLLQDFENRLDRDIVGPVNGHIIDKRERCTTRNVSVSMLDD